MTLMTFIWIAVALASALLEVTLPYFALIFAALAGLVAALLSALDRPWEMQAGGFVAALLFGLLLLRPRLAARLQSHRSVPSRTEALFGKRGRVIEDIGPEQTGRVEIEGLDWAARASESIPKGTPVLVESADGIILNVKRG